MDALAARTVVVLTNGARAYGLGNGPAACINGCGSLRDERG